MKHLPLTIIFFVLMLLTACGNPKVPVTHYYLLSAGQEQSEHQTEPTTSRLYLADIRLPQYLKQDHLVMKLSENKLHFSRYHQWAEGLAQAFAKSIKQQVHTANFVLRPSDSELSLVIEIDDFYPTEQGQVILTGRYWVNHHNAPDTAIAVPFNLRASLTTTGFEHAVKKMHLLVVLLAKQIALDVQ